MYATVIPAGEAARIIAGLTGVGLESRPDQFIDQVIAEYLRQGLCSLSQGGQPVYITRLTNIVRRQLAPLWPELYVFRERRWSLEEQHAEGDIHPDRVHRVLDILSDLRDFVELGEGYWLPAPVRLVTLPGSGRVLVVGGLATADLRWKLCPEVALAGFARTVPEGALPDTLRFDRSMWQPYGAWCGDPPADLKKWTEACIAHAQGQLRDSASNFSAFEIYAPWLRRGQPQYFRWMRFEDFIDEIMTPPRTLLLCRSIPGRLQVPRKYWLGIVDPKGLKREAPLPYGHARRLAYGMDLLYGVPTRAVWEDGTLVLRNWLPPEEHRILTAIGRETSLCPGRLPLRLEIGPEWRQFASESLNALGIEIKSR
ncbi:hypothetical protein MOOR_24330 [Moorella thermoacetica]|uniref:Uncharacterized protein n=1 Tax=Neomoorella thermoacetica TaxID=1525 RepID=A0A1J5JGH5_NEOTH|nr:hypothetical protein [Moorella thermoacetica]OIQ07932.1 hypothetical protein MOOR_24330 [Moorella thermoacetica]